MRLLRDFVARRLIGPVPGDEGEKVAGDPGSAPTAHQGHGRARPIGKALVQQGEIEQPFAGIIDDPDRHLCRGTGDLAEKLAHRVGRREAQIEADLADVDGASGPVRDASGHFFDIAEIREARQPVRLGAFKIGGDQAALTGHLEERHPVRIVECAQQIMDQAGDEHGLAGPAEPGHRQPDRCRARKFADIADQTPRRLGKDRRQPAQVQQGRHNFTSAAIRWAHRARCASAGRGGAGRIAGLGRNRLCLARACGPHPNYPVSQMFELVSRMQCSAHAIGGDLSVGRIFCGKPVSAFPENAPNSRRNP